MEEYKISQDNIKKARWLLDQTRANGGLAPLDIDRFWAEQKISAANPFGEDIPQVPLGIMMSGECVYDELGIPEDYWRYDHDMDWKIQLNKAYNEISEKIVGRRLLSEYAPDSERQWPAYKTIADLFEAQNVWVKSSSSYWLQESAHNEDELKALLDRVDARIENIREFLLPENWDAEKARLNSLGVPPPRMHGIRGPVTFATSIYGPQRLIFLIYDNPDLASRFRDTIIRGLFAITDLIDSEAGFTPGSAPPGYSFSDDNCYLLTPDMYEFFGYPILKAIFEKYSPNPGDMRGQHSDSSMSHIVPILAKLNMTWVNFGPTVMVSEIRRHMPNTVINGQLAPFTFSRNEEENIVLEFLRDFNMAREHKGLCFATAGSINNGSRLTGMRLIMSAIQHFGRYDS